MDDKKIIFSMSKVGKVYPGRKQVLKDISLSFYLGAKIGVLGLNGAGKSSLLRIIAAEDKDFLGNVVLNKDITVGYLEQDPKLDPEKTVKEIVTEGVQATANL
ncbi:MAG: ATP-binding cassette domain-containing protein, partial [Bacteriovoracaceae bacterium]|nr:ATP-binding cassette domain-containing protein [Bacteriovoracaceae bacterium]